MAKKQMLVERFGTLPAAEALFVAKDLNCYFYAIEGLKLARAAGSRFNI